MAEVALLLAVKKISELVSGEAQNLTSRLNSDLELVTQLPGSMSRIRREFVVMHAFLCNMDSEENNTVMEAWVEELRKIAHEVEDVVDDFVYILGDESLSKGICEIINKIIGRPQNIVALRRIALKLKEIESNLEHIIQIKNRWIRIADTNGKPPSITETDVVEPFQDTGDGPAVGIGENKTKLLKLLKVDSDKPDDAEEKQDVFILIHGPPGVGKTTLVSNVYDSAKIKFKSHAFVHVPSNFNLKEAQRLLIKKLSLEDDNHGDPHELLHDLLENKQCLIILDDVQAEHIQTVRNALAKNKHGSKIIITTEFSEVNDLVDMNHWEQLEVQPLNKENAIDLLFKKALSNLDGTKYRKELKNEAEKIVEKCDLLPLAIVSVGSLLLQREKSKSEWEKVYKQLEWLLTNNQSLSCTKLALGLSLKYLPKYLRNCFLFCSVFPRNYVFKRKVLIRLWIAEGFVERRGSSTMEEVAQDYLNELVNRSMVEVTERNDSGRLKRFRIHSFMKENLMSIAKKESFSILSHDLENVKHNHQLRHLSLYKFSERSGSTMEMPQLRSFMAIESTISKDFLTSVFANSLYLMVLDLQDTGIVEIPEDIGKLFNLHYLNLRKTKVNKLPKNIARLGNLQTLDLLYTPITELPREIVKLKKLRHLLVGTKRDPFKLDFNILGGVTAPKGMKELKNLQTLQGVDAGDELLEDLGRLHHIRSLRVVNVKKIHSKLLSSSVQKLPLLSTLEIHANSEEEQLDLTSTDANLNSLEKFELHGRLNEQVAKALLGNLGINLTNLYLGWTGLKEDHMPILGQLDNLAYLELNNTFEQKELHFPAKATNGALAFPKLRTLCIHNMIQLEKVIFDDGALKKLELLKLTYIGAVKNIEGIYFLEALQEVFYYEQSG